MANSLPSLSGALPGGIDVPSAVNSAMTAARQPEVLLQTQQTLLNQQNSVLTKVSTDLSTLQTKVNALKDITGALNSKATTSTDATLASATADATAQVGNHTIVVNNLATTSSVYSNELSNGNTAFAQGSISLKVGTNAAVPITVDGTDNTLTGLAKAINAKNLGVTASVINDTLGSRLALVSNNSGAAGNIAVTANTSGLNLTAVAGVDASVNVDGIPATSATNSVAGVIAGVTFNLASADPNKTVTIGVTADKSQAQSAIQDFVTAYNAVVNDINGQSTTVGGAGGVLAGDSTLRSLQQSILTDVSTSLVGNGGMVNLESIGVQLADDGTLTVNSATLGNALSSNFNAVQNLFQNSAGVATTFSTDLGHLTDTTQGSVALAIKGNSQTLQTLADSINEMEVTLSDKQQQLSDYYNKINVTLQQMPLLQQQITAQFTNLA